jgi:hypothetical protein
MQLLFKLTVVDLFEDVGIAGLVDLEGFVAVWANDVVHVKRAEG